MKTILVTGGMGYIGSHTVVELLQKDYNVVIVDNLSNSKIQVIERIQKITGKQPVFYKVDLLSTADLESVFKSHPIDAVIHFAGLKAVGESTQIPLDYYKNNVAGTINLCQLMQQFKILKLVFSSSATVYGDPYKVPIEENFPLTATNPYGRTKLMIEEILQDLYDSDNTWNISLLRYFNPVGAHETGLLGEDPHGIPNNLMPFIAQVAVGKLDRLKVFGDDYPTPDGTGVRDYIHVVDLARGHLESLKKLEKGRGIEAYNLGTGRGYSVMEMIQAFKKASGKKIPFEIVERRKGDIAQCYSNPDKAQRELQWRATIDINKMCADTWNWQSKNPNGYE